MFRIQVYNLPHIKEELVEFFEKYPEYGKEFTFTLDDEFTNADLAKLLNICGHTWLKFHDAKNMQRIADQNEIFEKINPDIKRASYGPFPPYATPHGSYNMLKYVGLDVDKDLSEFYKGWYQFEDYPSSCAYYAFRGAFAMMSMKLHNPKLKYYLKCILTESAAVQTDLLHMHVRRLARTLTSRRIIMQHRLLNMFIQLHIKRLTVHTTTGVTTDS